MTGVLAVGFVVMAMYVTSRVVEAVNGAFRDGLQQMRAPSVCSAADLGARVGLELVVGEPEAPIRPFLRIGTYSQSLRMQGTRSGRDVELVRYCAATTRWVRDRAMFRCEHASRLSIAVCSDERFDIAHRLAMELQSNRLALPIVHVGLGVIDDALDVRCGNVDLVRQLAPELAALADLPFVRVTLEGGLLSLQEVFGSTHLVDYGPRVLPVLDRIADRLEALTVPELLVTAYAPARNSR